MSEAIEFEVGFPVINEGDGEDGKSAYEVALEEGFVGTRAEWLLSLKGEDGGGGSGTGNDGKSAYELAVEDGFVGTESEWLLSLKGEDGTDGIDGEDAIDGIDGEDGEDGKSAYEVALEEGFVGTRAEWLLSLKGEDGGGGSGTGNDGKSAYELAVEDGFVGTESEWLLSLTGQSAYDIAVREDGFVGTKADWIFSLVGEDGIDGEDGLDGKSAYEVALEDGFVGTKENWIFSLIGNDGIDGKSAYELAVEDGFVGTESEWLLSLKGEDGSGGGGTGGTGGLPKGDWDMEETYNAGDIVEYEGYIFAGKVGSTNEEPIKYVGDDWDSNLVFGNWTFSGKATDAYDIISSSDTGVDHNNYGLMISDFPSLPSEYGEIIDKESLDITFYFNLEIEENTTGTDATQITRFGLVNGSVGSLDIDDADQWDNFLGLNIESGRADGVIEATVRGFGKIGEVNTEAFNVGVNEGYIKISLNRQYEFMSVDAEIWIEKEGGEGDTFWIFGDEITRSEGEIPVDFDYDNIKATIYANNTYLENQNLYLDQETVRVDLNDEPWSSQQISPDWMAIADAPYFYF